ncbi:MAG TPA: hypothetical protein VKB80_28620 [Kofleriaceae bacterium]|nr:hypothetical protein [Kofleriaceae bacterium]
MIDDVVFVGALEWALPLWLARHRMVDVIDKGGAQVHGAVDVNDHVYANRSSRLW